MRSIFWLTLRQSSGRIRLLIMSALSVLPVLMALVAVRDTRAPSVEEFEQIVLSTMLAGSIMPLVVLTIASVAFANEIEDRTLANLTLAPIPRWRIVVPKLVAGVVVSAPFIAATAFVTSYVAYTGDVTATVAVTLASFIGVLLYSAAFVWLGLVSTKAIGFGLLYIVLWEGFFSGFVSNIKFLSIRHYALAWMHGLDARRFAAADVMSFEAVVATSVVVFGGFVLLSIRRLRRMDVP